MIHGWSGGFGVARLGRSLMLSSVLLVAMAGSLAGQEIPTVTLKPPTASLREAFTRIRSVRELGDGRVLISDPSARRVVVADLDKNQVRNEVRRGTRPEEVPPGVSPTISALQGDSTLLFDTVRRWLGILDGVRLVATPGSPFLGYSASMIPDRLGHTLLEIGSIGLNLQPTRLPDTLVVLVRVPLLAGRTVDSLTTLRMSRASKPSDPPGTPLDPFRVSERATIAPDGWIAVVRVAPYRIDWWSPTNGWHMGNPIAVPAVPLVGAELAAKKEQPVIRDPRWILEYPAEVPRFSTWGRLPTNTDHQADVLATPDSLVLVRITPTLAFPGTRYDVIDRHGVLRHTLVLPVDERIVGFGAGTVYVVQRNSKGEERLRRHPWP